MSEYIIQGTTLTGIGDKIRVLCGTEDAMTPVAMQTNLDTFNTDLGAIASEQDTLIANIITALEGKVVGGGVETVNVTFTIYGGGTIYYMGAEGIATLTSPYEQTVAVVKDSPVTIIYDGSTTLVLQYGSGYTQHYDNAWSYSGHSCSVLSFYEDGNVLYAES